MALRPQNTDTSWDQHKENIQPLKFGRSVSNVETNNESLLKDQRLKFEEEIRANIEDDPLEVWYRYIKWTEQNFPSGKDNQLRLLIQKCLQALKTQKQYANDVRWWYVWQKFASLSHNVGSLGIYDFMYSDGICTRLASFYKQWAAELELNEDYAKATSVYKKGILAEAQPLDDLEHAFHEYQSRVGRLVVAFSEESDINEEPTRNLLGVLKSVGKKATAPVVRQSVVQDVKISKPVAAGSSAFAVYNENKTVQETYLPASSKAVNISSIGSDSAKENFRKPDIWTKQKVKQGFSAPSKETATDFKVYSDNSVIEEVKKPIISGNVLKPVTKTDISVSPFCTTITSAEKKPAKNKVDYKEVMAYNEQIVNGGMIEMSFEEARALLYDSIKSKENSKINQNLNFSAEQNNSKPSSFVCTDSGHSALLFSNGKVQQNQSLLNKSSSVLSSRSRMESCENNSKPVEIDKENTFAPRVNGNLFKQQNNAVPVPTGGIVANTSFTCNIVRDAIAVFSDTLPLNNFGNDGSGHLVDNSGSFARHESGLSAEFVESGNQRHIVSAASFKVYDESVEKKSRSVSNLSPDGENKENIVPFHMISNPSVKRQTSGILVPAADIVVDNSEQPPFMFSIDNRTNFSALQSVIPDTNIAHTTSAANLSSMLTHFQLDEPTVAGLMKTLLADRAASTPCHTGSILSLPSFSTCKPWEIPLNLDNQSSFDSEDCSKPKTAPEIEKPTFSIVPVPQNEESNTNVDYGHPSIYNYATQTKLSTIVETSREYRSSSCSSSSSGSSTSDGFGSRKRLLSGSTNSTNLQPIYEQFTFDHFTPSSRAISFGVTPQNFALRRAQENVTPHNNKEMYEPNLPQATQLYSTDENVDENCDRTGFGTKILITSRVNPWDPDVLAQLLMRIPKRLDLFTNYHHFSSKLPAIKVGKTTELGGEIYTVEKLIGEGAFAKVYKCCPVDSAQVQNLNIVLKIQKPSCPWEFFICEELRRRLSNENLLPIVNHGVMRIQDGYIFSDGSALLYDYCSYGTLLDFVNVYKKSSSCLTEFFAIYLTIEMLLLLECVHSCKFIHADVKPDNFLFCALDNVKISEVASLSPTKSVFCLRLIDWGRAIDMNLLPAGTTFCGKVNASGFQCCEMLDNRPWTYQTDYYGLLGTVHVLLFGEYMRVYKCNATGRWKMTSSFKRRWKVDLWRTFFDDLLNIADCNSLPRLSSYRTQFESYWNFLQEEECTSLATELSNFQEMWNKLN